MNEENYISEEEKDEQGKKAFSQEISDGDDAVASDNVCEPSELNNGDDQVANESTEYIEAKIELVFDPQMTKSTFSKVGLGIAAFVLLSVSTCRLIMLLMARVAPSFYNTNGFKSFISPFCLYVIALPALLLICTTVKPSAPEKKKFGFGKWLLFLLVCFGCMYIGAVVGNVVTLAVEAILGYSTSAGLEEFFDGMDTWTMLLSAVVIAPIGEEFVFRKLMIDRLGRFGCFPSVFLSALAFGLMHGNFKQFFFAFAVGLVMGYVYYVSGKLYLTIALHATVNFVCGVVSRWLSEGLDGVILEGDMLPSITIEVVIWLVAAWVFLMFVSTAVVSAVSLPIIFKKTITLDRGKSPIPKGNFASAVFANFGVVAMMVVLVARFAMVYLIK